MENNDENRPPKPQTPKIHKSSPFSSSPLQLIRNFASLSNRGSPSSPLGRLFGKVNIQIFDIFFQNKQKNRQIEIIRILIVVI